jgi:hypothetical protein
VGGEKKSRRQQAGWSLLESGPSTAQCRDKRATCRTTAPQSLYSIPSLVPRFGLECRMMRSTGGDEMGQTSSTAIQAAAMRWSLVNESSGLCHRISDNCAGHGNRQIPVQHPHDFGPELRAIWFNTSVVPCLGSWKTHFKKLSVSLQSMRPLSKRWHIETKREVDEVARYHQIDE